jgi:hypothetical protein
VWGTLDALQTHTHDFLEEIPSVVGWHLPVRFEWAIAQAPKTAMTKLRSVSFGQALSACIQGELRFVILRF